ncbi:MAG: serine/threonine-protein kinase [Longimicrobiales bacterium]
MTSFEEQLKDSISHVYDIERELGGGGMSRVFVATDRNLGRKIVIKLLSPELTAGVNRDRFRREMQVAAQFQHPHIVPLLSAGEHGDIVYYTMPFVEGESLKSALEKGPLSVKDVVRVLNNVVDALGYAHARGVVHRDIKPANILRSGSHSLVTDFGVAKALNAAMASSPMTSTGMAVGTPAYMAPEQLAGDPAADHRIDIYAVGLLGYELLTGKSPFAALSPQAVMAAIFNVDPKPVHQIRTDVPQRLSTIIMQCLAKDAADRPPSAEALLDGLDAITTSSGQIRTREYQILKEATAGTAAGLSTTPVNAQPSVQTGPAVFAVPIPLSTSSAAPVPYTTNIATPMPVIPIPIPIPTPTPTAPMAAVSSATVPGYVEEKRSNRGLIVAGILFLLIAGIAGAMYAKRGSSSASASATALASKGADGQNGAGAPGAAGAAGAAGANAVVAPPVVIDSQAIAEAFRKKMEAAVAAAVAAKPAPGKAAVNEDSLRRAMQKAMKDSITKATAKAQALADEQARDQAAAAAAAAAAAPPPVAARAPNAPFGKPRMGIAELREKSDQSEYNAFSKLLTAGIRNALDRRDLYNLIDQDSVHDAMGRTSNGDEAARILEPEVLIVPSIQPSGTDSVRITVSIRDMRRGSGYGLRVISMIAPQTYPKNYVPALVDAIQAQLNNLPKAPRN